MISRNISLGCYAADVCRPSSCGKSAQCETVSSGISRCVCQIGEIGDGKNCYGSLLYGIQALNIEDFQMRKKAGALRLFEEGCGLTLRKYGPYTVFVPLMKTLPMNETTAKQLCNVHIIPGQFMVNDFTKIGKLWTISGEVLEFSGTIFKKISEPETIYKLVKTNLPAANGILHMIDKPIKIGNVETIGSQRRTIGDILANTEKFSRFETLLENCGLPPILNGHGPFTVFVPSNKAIDSLRDGRLIYLLTQAKHKLLELVKYHISSIAAVTLDRLMMMPHILTTSDEIIKINVTENGRILFGNKGIPLIHSDIIASNGVIHTLDGILIPSNILPILPAICNETDKEVIQGPCSSCDSIPPCPDNTTDSGIVDRECSFGDLRTTKGCARNCSRSVVVAGCCSGFYGSNCKPCPGGYSNPCYGRGTCNDGIHGNGKCVCFQKYKGIACHICSNPDKHGEECEDDCRCVHGTCDNRSGSRGVCQGGRCKEGYVGEFCDKRSEPCGSLNMTQYCHLNAVCVSTDNITSCLCANGYEGDGTFCQPVDECKKPDRGGCSENAICTIIPTGAVSCQCNPGWNGDGIECLPIDNCALENRGGCDVNANCIFIQPGKNECTCKKGYAGDGYICDPVNRCLENNGDCHEMATCKPMSGGERTCTCLEGFMGNGFTCYGDMLMELLRIPDVSIFNQWLKDSKVRIPQNVTALIPSDAAIGVLTQDDKKFWLDSYTLPFLIRGHFLRQAFTSDQLKQHSGQELPTLDPRTKWEMNLIKGNLTVHNASVIASDIPAISGFIFIINQVLIPPRGNIPPALPGLYQKLDQVPAFEQFKKAIQKSGLIQEIESSKQQYTIFVPDNSAVAKFYNQSGSNELDNRTIKYHIILGEKLLPSDIRNGMHKGSMLGISYWLMFYIRYNQTFVHDVLLNGNFFVTNNGMLVEISEVLPILKNRCDTTEITVKKTKCSSCNKGIQCPQGTVLQEQLGRGLENCTIKRRNNNMIQGCKFNCITSKVVHLCCDGYYGHQCLVCPGGIDNVCSKNGKCQDGITGSGECICKEGFHGTACESCEAGRYGSDCKSECECVHGKCNDGLHGDGSCQCDKGWSGYSCQIDNKNDSCNGSCNYYANCIAGPTNQTAKCVCLAGYTGNGTHCTEIDACAVNNGGCSKYANCTKAPLGQARCTCSNGYNGDGVICLEIDACLEYNGGCHAMAECTKTGPNKVACNCLQGYEGDGTSICKEINICKKDNGGCSPYALCMTIGLQRLCYCRVGFIGDGITCLGSIAQVIGYNAEAIPFSRELQNYKIKDLAGEGTFTVFIPQEEAVKNNSMFAEWKQKGPMKYLLRYHLVGCQKLLTDELKKLPSLISVSGGIIRLSTKNGEVFLNDFARITKSDIIAKNGVIHFIDNVLIPEAPTNTSLQALNISQVAAHHGYSKFSQLLKDSNLLSVVNDKIHQPFTMLWPTDKAFDSLPEERKKWLYHEDHRDKLEAYLKVHIIRDTKISAASLPEAKSLRTLHGSTVSFQCSTTNIGDILVNENNAMVIQRDLEFNGGIAHGIDQLLEPPNIGARCDEFTVSKFSNLRETCSFCGSELPCPSGSVDRGEIEECIHPSRRTYGRLVANRRVRYRHQYHSSSAGFLAYGRLNHGCSKKCYIVSWTPRCCKNHYGGDCHVCPGGLEAPCSNHGTCMDGFAGKGRCTCTEGFNGTACEICAPNRYGSDCKECTCSENGQCNDGISGDGSCFCSEGWSGQNCEIKLATNPVCSPECDGNATCRAKNECECNPYYEGDGRTCSVIDQCQDNNGGCSNHGQCSQVGVRVSCVCFPGYEGDGYVCTPINICANGENGGCSEHATCIYTGPNMRRCDCHDAYVGNGVQCLERAIPPVDRCLEVNGDCDPLAVCSDLHFEEKTAGVFHLQSPNGKYKFTYEEADSACQSEGAKIATFQQLSAAQQLGYHRCLVGWLYNRTAGYPTVYPRASCGSNHVGIVDYKQRTNMSETWDVYCYRFQDTLCECTDGYVGDGSFCNGNLLEVIEANSRLSRFYSMILDYGNSSAQGSTFLDVLSNRTSYKTLFVPEDDSFEDNVTLTWRDLEHHMSQLDILVPYTNLTHGSTLLSKIGYNLSISEHSNCSKPLCPKVVNDKAIIQWDIPAFNGIIHIINGPLIAPPVQEETQSQISHPITAVLVTIIMIILIVTAASISYFYYRQRLNGFRFRHFEGEEDDMDILDGVNPPLICIPNPVYGANTSFFDQFEDPYNGEDCSDTFKILH
ncbi:stabilin-1 isoform X2 [Mixophyes fleayi]